MAARLYRGDRREGMGRVYGPDGQALDPRHDLYPHELLGLGWGDSTPACHQTALAVACDVLGDDLKALRAHRELASRVFGRVQASTWAIERSTLERELRRIEADLDRRGESPYVVARSRKTV